MPQRNRHPRPGARRLALLVSAAGCGAEDGATVQDGPTSQDAIAPDWCQGLPRAGYATLERIELDFDWFEAWSVGDGVVALYEPKQWQEIISYLVLGSERALLFDTGMGIASIRDVVNQLTNLPVTVVNSHSHVDHVGGNAEFTTVLGMDTEFTRARSGGLPNARVREEVTPGALCAPLPAGVTEDTYRSRAWTIAGTVADGDTIDLGGRSLEIVALPGHTPDALALLDRAAGYLWTGDSFYEGPIWLFAPETDLDAYARSVDRMAELAPTLDRVFPAHNTPVAEPERLVELRDAFTAIREGRLDGTAGEGGTLRYDVGAFSLLLRAPDAEHGT